MIQLTETAANALKSAIKASNDPMQGLRISVEAGGCAGHKYVMGLVPAGNTEDVVVEDQGVKLFIDSASASLLNGTTIDFVVSMEGSGFTFRNPQAKQGCSCGKSFS